MESDGLVSSNYFFHFTNKIENIEDMFLNGFKPFYCPEQLEYFFDNDLRTIKMAYPVICFCDLPLNLQAEHRIKFKGYGIGLKKSWGLNNHLTPVIYSHEGSLTSAILKNFIDTYKKIEEYPNRFGLGSDDLMGLKKYISLFIMSVKPYEGHRYIKKEMQFSEKITRFYDEREWRYIPLKVDGLKLNLEIEEYQNEKILAEENEKIQKDNKINFEINDVEYIFLKCKSEIDGFISKLSSKYTEQDLIKIKNIICVD